MIKFERLIDEDRLKEALEYVENEVVLRESAVTYFTLRGKALVFLNRPQDALLDVNNALEIDPNNFNALVTKGLALNDLNKNTDAMDAFNKAITINPRDNECLRHRANVKHGIGYTDASSLLFSGWNVNDLELQDGTDGIHSFFRESEINKYYHPNDCYDHVVCIDFGGNKLGDAGFVEIFQYMQRYNDISRVFPKLFIMRFESNGMLFADNSLSGVLDYFRSGRGVIGELSFTGILAPNSKFADFIVSLIKINCSVLYSLRIATTHLTTQGLIDIYNALNVHNTSITEFEIYLEDGDVSDDEIDNGMTVEFIRKYSQMIDKCCDRNSEYCNSSDTIHTYSSVFSSKRAVSQFGNCTFGDMTMQQFDDTPPKRKREEEVKDKKNKRVKLI